MTDSTDDVAPLPDAVGIEVDVREAAKALHLKLSVLVVLATVMACGGSSAATPEAVRCQTPPHARVDASTPRAVAADWAEPVRLGAPINTACPEDAIEISPDGRTLYFLFTMAPLGAMSPETIFLQPNGTYRANRIGGPADFADPVFYDLGQGVDASLDGELSFALQGRRVYFHSLRSENTGYQLDPPVDDYLDIYVAEIVGGLPGPARNLGAPVNSPYPDGEHAIHPDGVTLYFASPRPAGLGNNDIWVSQWDGTTWSNPVNLGAAINSEANELQPAFASDGNTMYFTSDRDPSIGMAIYRSSRTADSWGAPELVIQGMVGEPSITADGTVLYFVHILADADGVFDADVWLSERSP